jgi:hypothetical protein
MTRLHVQPAKPTAGTARSTLDWMFRDRKTGRIVIAQFPNIPLAVWIIATALRWLAHGTTNTVLTVIAMLALTLWASDEIIRGVNPRRRSLGALVLSGMIVDVSMSA